MKKSLIALLVMVGLVGGILVAGCGAKQEEPKSGTSQTSMEQAAKSMGEAAQSGAEAAKSAVESATKTGQ